MRPGRVRPGCRHPANALHIKAIPLALRAVARHDGLSLAILRVTVFTMSKSPNIPMKYGIRADAGFRTPRGHSKDRGGCNAPSTSGDPPVSRGNPILLYYGGLTVDFRECFADAFHGELDPVRRSDIDQEHVIFSVLHQFAQARLQFCAPPSRQPALENRKLKPLAVVVHGFENAAPTPLIGNVVSDDEQAVVGHRIDLGIETCLSAADNADSSAVLPAGTATTIVPAPAACDACSPDTRRRDASFLATGVARTPRRSGGALPG
jgi:hypothetical protein